MWNKFSQGHKYLHKKGFAGELVTLHLIFFISVIRNRVVYSILYYSVLYYSILLIQVIEVIEVHCIICKIYLRRFDVHWKLQIKSYLYCFINYLLTYYQVIVPVLSCMYRGVSHITLYCIVLRISSYIFVTTPAMGATVTHDKKFDSHRTGTQNFIISLSPYP